jgi:hypothetical protein
MLQPYEADRTVLVRSVVGLRLAPGIMSDLEDRARAGGASVVRLDTNGTLTEAISLYRSLGYAEIPAYNDEPYAHHWFEKWLRT